VVALWFGTNAAALRLRSQSSPDSTVISNCVAGTLTGTRADFFGQVSYCNSPNFFQAAFSLISAGKLVVPALGTALDGQPCPTVRDFGIVDQDQSDNVITTYILTEHGTIAQNTTSNRKRVNPNQPNPTQPNPAQTSCFPWSLVSWVPGDQQWLRQLPARDCG